MCKAPKIPKPKDDKDAKPEWLRNPYLDGAMGQASAVNQLRTGRSSLRIDLGSSPALPSPAAPLITPPPTLAIAPPHRSASTGRRDSLSIRTQLK